jgi:LysM domain
MKRRTRLAIAAGCLFTAIFAVPGIASAQTQHQVVAGDTLWAIGIANGTTWQALAAYNHVPNPDLIFVGQTIVIPDGSYVAPAAATVAPIHHYVAPVQHVVTTPSASGSFQSCVAYRESSNTPTDEAGMYGIIDSTWHSLGYSGNAGSAPLSVQNEAFNKLYSEYGTSPWAPYDGC